LLVFVFIYFIWCEKINSEIESQRISDLMQTVEWRAELCEVRIMEEVDSGANEFVSEELDWVDEGIYQYLVNFTLSDWEDVRYSCVIRDSWLFIELEKIDLNLFWWDEYYFDEENESDLEEIE